MKSWIELSLLLGRKNTSTSLKYMVFDYYTQTNDIQMSEATSECFASVEQTLSYPHISLMKINFFSTLRTIFFYVFPGGSIYECSNIITKLRVSKLKN